MFNFIQVNIYSHFKINHSKFSLKIVTIYDLIIKNNVYECEIFNKELHGFFLPNPCSDLNFTSIPLLHKYE